MVLVSYDISSDKLRTKFAKDLSKFGFRLQYSLFEIQNSEHMLRNIVQLIENKYEKQFEETDSVLIIRLNPNCEIRKYGYAEHEDETLIVIG